MYSHELPDIAIYSHVLLCTAMCSHVMLCIAMYIENTSWKVLAYGIYARVVDVSEIEQVSAANE